MFDDKDLRGVRAGSALAAAVATLASAGAVGAAAKPPDVWTALGAANAVGGDLSGHFYADQMSASSCKAHGATRTCTVEITKSQFDPEAPSSPADADCSWDVTVRRTTHGVRHSVKRAGCNDTDEDGKPDGFAPVHRSKATRRSKAHAYRVAGAVATRRARSIRADETTVQSCDTHESSERICVASINHRGPGARCSYLVIVPSARSRRHARTLSLGPCVSTG
jgi:hypothetical protein